MCGIAGILRTYPAGTQVPPREESIREEWLDILDESIKHRGPDGAGRFRDRVVRADGTTVDVALIHRRMAIIDLAGGHQPMLLKPDEPDAPDQVVVVFNGCIYNHRELRKELEAEGARFRTNHSDTEVLLWGWRYWSTDLFARLNGMFALAIWDRNAGELMCAVDHFSEKPLYVTSNARGASKTNSFGAFASTAAALVRLRADLTDRLHEPLETSPIDLQGWMQFGWNQSTPHSCLRSRHFQFDQLQPDNLLALSRNETIPSESLDNIWFTVMNPTRHALGLSQAETMLRDAVIGRLEADVPVGVFLSGGVDSALVTAFAREVRPDIKAFTVRMPTTSHDESAAATATARHLGVSHHILECDPNAAIDLVQAIEQLGLPFADSSLLPSIWLSRAASKHVKVALGGDGGDDLFLGYQRQFIAPKLLALGVDSSLTALARWVRTQSLLGIAVFSKPIRMLDAIAHGGYKDLAAIFPDSLFAELVRPPFDPNALRHFGHVPHPCSDPEWADLLHRRFDAAFYLPFDLLRKADTASMSAPLELRCPFLDSKLAFAAINATRESLLLNGQRKGLLRALARKYLPASIVDRPKMGFAIPLADWFRSDFGSLRTLLGDLVINAQDPFPADILGCELNRSFIRELFDQHMSGKRDHAQRLYALLVMAIWCRWYRRVSRTTDGLAR